MKKAYWLSHSFRNKGEKIQNVIDTIGDLLKYARLDMSVGKYFPIPPGELDLDIPWWAINDDGRQVSDKVGFSSTREFFEQPIKDVLNGHSPCLAHSQENHIEIWAEKQGLYHIIQPVADDFCRQTLAVRGDASVTSLHDYAERIENLKFKRYIILYFGDFNIKGIQIPETIYIRIK